MARSRTVNPRFFKDEDLAAKSERVRLCFLGLLTLADREGRLEYRPMLIRAEIFPHDQHEDTESLLAELAAERRWSPGSFLTIYEADGRHYIQVNNFRKYQHPHPKEPKSVIPPPPTGRGRSAASNGNPGADRAGSSIPSIPSIPSGSSGSSQAYASGSPGPEDPSSAVDAGAASAARDNADEGEPDESDPKPGASGVSAPEGESSAKPKRVRRRSQESEFRWNQAQENFLGPGRQKFREDVHARYGAEFGAAWIQRVWRKMLDWCRDNPEAIRAKRDHRKFALGWFRRDAATERERRDTP